MPPQTPAAPLPDEELLQYYVQYRLGVFRFCKAFLKDEDLAHDALQEVFIRVALCGVPFRQVENKQGWLITVARNWCLDRRRHGKAQFELKQRFGAELAPSREDPLHEIRDQLQQLLKHPQLDDRDRLLLQLLYENASMAEAALAMGLSPQAANRRRRRLAELAREMENGDVGDTPYVH